MSKYSLLTEEEKEKRRISSRKYYATHKAQVVAKNKASKKARGHLWTCTTRAKCLEYERRSDAKKKLDPVRWAKQQAQWRGQSRKRIDEKNRIAFEYWKGWMPNAANDLSPLSKIRIRQEVIIAYGGCCTCCGEDNTAFLTLDHVNGDGSVRRAGGEEKGIPFYREIKRLGFPADLQLLCWNCNEAKHHYGICPHQVIAKGLLNGGIATVIN